MGLVSSEQGMFFGKQSLFQETINSTSVAFKNSAAGRSVKSFGSNQLQKPSLIMINIVAKPFEI